MNDKVLSDGEMSALMEDEDAVREMVMTKRGPREAQVGVFEIEPRSHFRFGSYPELQRLNEQSAAKVQAYLQSTLKWPVNCSLVNQAETTWQQCQDRFSGLQLSLAYDAEPLGGPVLFLPDVALTCALVEVLFGSVVIPATPDHPERFSQGQIRIAQRFASKVLSLMADVWLPILPHEFTNARAEQALDRMKIGEARDRVIISRFRIDNEDFSAEFSVVHPHLTIRTLLDRLEGAQRSQSVEQNRQWSAQLARHLHQVRLTLSARNVPVRLKLGALDTLNAGQVLPIERPESLTIVCGDRDLGRASFGINEDRYCIRLKTPLAIGAERAGEPS